MFKDLKVGDIIIIKQRSVGIEIFFYKISAIKEDVLEVLQISGHSKSAGFYSNNDKTFTVKDVEKCPAKYILDQAEVDKVLQWWLEHNYR